MLSVERSFNKLTSQFLAIHPHELVTTQTAGTEQSVSVSLYFNCAANKQLVSLIAMMSWQLVPQVYGSTVSTQDYPPATTTITHKNNLLFTVFFFSFYSTRTTVSYTILYYLTFRKEDSDHATDCYTDAMQEPPKKNNVAVSIVSLPFPVLIFLSWNVI